VDSVRIGIPTLNQYTLLGKLIINLGHLEKRALSQL